MADLSLNASLVIPGSGALFKQSIAGASITAGQTVYDATDNTAKLADANASATAANIAGIAMHAASSGQAIRYQYAGEVTIGVTTLDIGKVFIGSATAGGICPVTDLSTGWYTNIVGISKTNSIIKLGLLTAGVATT